MRKRSNTTRPFTIAVTQTGYRRLKRLADDETLAVADVLSFVFENFDEIIDDGAFQENMRQFKFTLQD
ncbi:MAG: hypothetical protein ABJ360_01965 [Roseobacter sp.]